MLGHERAKPVARPVHFPAFDQPAQFGRETRILRQRRVGAPQ